MALTLGVAPDVEITGVQLAEYESLLASQLNDAGVKVLPDRSPGFRAYGTLRAYDPGSRGLRFLNGLFLGGLLHLGRGVVNIRWDIRDPRGDPIGDCIVRGHVSHARRGGFETVLERSAYSLGECLTPPGRPIASVAGARESVFTPTKRADGRFAYSFTLTDGRQVTVADFAEHYPGRFSLAMPWGVVFVSGIVNRPGTLLHGAVTTTYVFPGGASLEALRPMPGNGLAKSVRVMNRMAYRGLTWFGRDDHPVEIHEDEDGRPIEIWNLHHVQGPSGAASGVVSGDIAIRTARVPCLPEGTTGAKTLSVESRSAPGLSSGLKELLKGYFGTDLDSVEVLDMNGAKMGTGTVSGTAVAYTDRHNDKHACTLETISALPGPEEDAASEEAAP